MANDSTRRRLNTAPQPDLSSLLALCDLSDTDEHRRRAQAIQRAVYFDTMLEHAADSPQFQTLAIEYFLASPGIGWMDERTVAGGARLYQASKRMWGVLKQEMAERGHRSIVWDFEQAVKEHDSTAPDRERKPARPQKQRQPDVVTLSEVEPEEVQWLWEPYIPLGKLTLLDGDPGLGKTFLALQLRSRPLAQALAKQCFQIDDWAEIPGRSVEELETGHALLTHLCTRLQHAGVPRDEDAATWTANESRSWEALRTPPHDDAGEAPESAWAFDGDPDAQEEPMP